MRLSNDVAFTQTVTDPCPIYTGPISLSATASFTFPKKLVPKCAFPTMSRLHSPWQTHAPFTLVQYVWLLLPHLHFREMLYLFQWCHIYTDSKSQCFIYTDRKLCPLKWIKFSFQEKISLEHFFQLKFQTTLCKLLNIQLWNFISQWFE